MARDERQHAKDQIKRPNAMNREFDRGDHSKHDAADAHKASTITLAKGAIDPVCGMTVNPATTPYRYQYQDRTYYFCSAEAARPNLLPTRTRYLEGKTAPAQAVAEGTIYTCPMHPEIRQVGPGSCPICGMALEPAMATADTAPNAELVDMTRRFWIGLVLTLPVFVLEMGSHLVDIHGLIDPSLSSYIQFAFATPVVLWAGMAILRAWRTVARHAQSQHVHADRDGHRRGLRLQPRGNVCAQCLSGGISWSRRISRRLF